MGRGLALLAGAAAALAVAAPASAAPGTSYGGAAQAGRFLTTSISLLHRTDGRIAARVGLGFGCAKRNFFNVVVRAAGPPPGATFAATGRRRIIRGGRLEVALTGTMDAATATGTLTLAPAGPRFAGCKTRTRAFVLKAESAPAGAPARPAPRAQLWGLTAQAAGALRLPVALKVNADGSRVMGLWQARMRCGPKAVLTVVNLTPPTRIRADATFRRRERYSIRFRDGSVDRYRVVFRGHLLADGAVGTLRARMQTSKAGASFFPCDSGARRWTAAF